MQAEFNKIVGQTIEDKRAVLAEAITERHFQLKPELIVRYGERGRAKCLKDADYHLSYLSESIAASRPELFADYIAWAKILLAGFGIDETDLADNLKVVQTSLQEHLPENESAVACEYIDAGLEQVKQSSSGLSSFIKLSEPLSDLANNYLNALLSGERQTANRLIMDAVGSGTDIRDIYLSVFQPAQHEIGRLWQINKLSVAQEHYCTAATQMIMSQLYPYIFGTEKIGRTMVAACVSGDYHEIGVRMVADFFEMEGWNTFYLGANTPTPGILQILAEQNADLIVISATMTFHVRAVRELIIAIRSAAATKNVKIMVGGYPFNVAPDLWKDVGADASSRDAVTAVEVGARLVGIKNG
jgi:MerR family transcriptional regulator, light-induced transcriptional regulator